IKDQTNEVFKKPRTQEDAQEDLAPRNLTITEMVKKSFSKLDSFASSKLTDKRLVKMQDRAQRKIKLNNKWKEEFQKELNTIKKFDKPMAHQQWIANWNKHEALRKKMVPKDKPSDLRKKADNLTKEIDNWMEGRKVHENERPPATALSASHM